MPRREALTSLRGIYIFNSVDHANLSDDRLLIRRDGAVIVRGLSGLADRVHHVHTVRHIAEAGVLTVQKCAVGMADEKLGAGAVHIL